MVLGSWVASAPGAVYGWLAASVASILVLHIMMHFGARLRLHWPTVRALIISGIPLAAMAFADTLLVSLDGTLLLRRSTTTFGLYSGIAMQTRRYLFNLARSLTFVLMPHMLEAFARVGSPEALRRTSLNAATAASWAVPTFSLITAILLPAATRAVVPKFYAAVPAGQIVAFSAPLMILPLAFSTVLVSLNAEWHSVSAQLLGAGAIAVLGWRTAGEGDMVGMAVASTVGYLTVALGVSWMAMSRLGLGPGRIVRTLLGLLAPVALSPAVFLIAELLTRDLAGWPSDTWAGCGTRMLIALVLTAPTLLLAERRHQMLGRCVRALGRLRRPVGTEGLADAREQP
jgi:O-antigen/teichoic acid export membrane protein